MSITEPNEMAFPIEVLKQFGLTKREYFAAMAMQGFCACDSKGEDEWILLAKGSAELSVMFADALITELNKPPKP